MVFEILGDLVEILGWILCLSDDIFCMFIVLL